MAEKQPIEQPHHVRIAGNSEGSGFVHGFAEKASAEADADRRNAVAKDLGIKTRYEAVDK